MIIKSKSIGKRLPVSALKARLVANAVKGMKAEKALGYLEYIPNKSAKFISKIISSAISNLTSKVEGAYKIDEEKLYVENILVDKGPIRSMRRARTRTRYKKKKFRAPLCKRSSCHISVFVQGEQEETKRKK